MKLIDADKLIEKLSAGLDNPEELPVISIGTVMRMIDGEEEIHTSQPEIIFCKDCKHKGTKNCVANAWTTIFGFGVKDDFYCGLAERRTNE